MRQRLLRGMLMGQFFIETYGCQMNVAESNAIESLLLAAGWTAATKPEDADLAIINTCSVRKSAENRIWGRLGAYKHFKDIRASEGKSMILVLTGCMADRIEDELKKSAPHIDHVVGNNGKLRILEGDFSSYVPIMNGCNNFCSYCIVPYVRGREISRCPEQILEEIRFLDSKGVREITLLGQNVNSYSYEDCDFPALLERICAVCDNIRWIRFESPHPKDFSDRLIEVIAAQDKVAKHLHVPMQSGSTRILGLMNRRYTREAYLSLIERIKAKIPEMTFAVDVMVGFPGETEEEFQETLSAMKEVGYIEAYMYYWNPREGTRACSMEGQIPESERQKRLQTLIDWQLENAASIKAGRAHGVQEVLVTQVSRDNPNQMLGRNEHNEMVAFDVLEGSSVRPGDMLQVEFRMLNGNTYLGRQVK